MLASNSLGELSHASTTDVENYTKALFLLDGGSSFNAKSDRTVKSTYN
jgi:hypothetical protein